MQFEKKIQGQGAVTKRQAATQTDRQRGRQRHRQTDKEAGSNTDRQSKRQAAKQTDRQRGRQRHRQKEKEAGSNTDRQSKRDGKRPKGLTASALVIVVATVVLIVTEPLLTNAMTVGTLIVQVTAWRCTPPTDGGT